MESQTKGENLNFNMNINQYKILAPVISALLLNSLKSTELIALQEHREFDAEKELSKLIKSWTALTVEIQDLAAEADYLKRP